MEKQMTLELKLVPKFTSFCASSKICLIGKLRFCSTFFDTLSSILIKRGADWDMNSSNIRLALTLIC